MFGLVNFLWGDIGLSGKSQKSSTGKPQVFIKSQTGVMVKKLWIFFQGSQKGHPHKKPKSL